MKPTSNNELLQFLFWILMDLETSEYLPSLCSGSIPAEREPGTAEEQCWDLNFWGLVISILCYILIFVLSFPSYLLWPVNDTAPFAVQAEVTMKTNFFGTRNVCTELLPIMKPYGEWNITNGEIEFEFWPF